MYNSCEGVEGDYVYTVTDGNVTIEDYLGTDTEIVIPSTIAGKPVTEIGPMSFWMDDNMTSVVIPERSYYNRETSIQRK